MSSMVADLAEPLDDSPPDRQTAASRWRWPVAEAAFWAAHTLFWLVTFAVALVVLEVVRPGASSSASTIATHLGLCFLATAVMRWLSWQEPLLVRLGVSKIGVMAGGAIISAVLITLVMAWVDRLVGVASSMPSRMELVARLAINLTLLANWCALYFGFQLIRERNSTEFRAMQAESLALRNELQHLQGQISPHFLFNALNTVMACRDDPEAIDTVTQALANYLRFLLRPAATLEPLARELDALEEYLTVQGMRFGDGLVTSIDCDLEARGVVVPPVMVQPLVENAIKYGGQAEERPIRVQVTARREATALVVEVANTGRWVAAGSRHSTGTGLNSLERRLRLLVGPGASVGHQEDNGWVRVLIRVPIARPPAAVALGETR